MPLQRNYKNYNSLWVKVTRFIAQNSYNEWLCVYHYIVLSFKIFEETNYLLFKI